MYLTSMTHEELYAEVHKDLIEISTKANMFMDKVRKKTKKWWENTIHICKA